MPVIRRAPGLLGPAWIHAWPGAGPRDFEARLMEGPSLSVLGTNMPPTTERNERDLPERRIDGTAFSTLEGFYDEVERALIPGADWGRSLDAFNDILRGGFGTPDEGFVLIWTDAHLSRQRLGYDEAASVLQDRVGTCHASNRDAVQAKAQAATRGEGPTLFDTLVEIIRDHGLGGEQAEDSILLRLT